MFLEEMNLPISSRSPFSTSKFNRHVEKRSGNSIPFRSPNEEFEFMKEFTACSDDGVPIPKHWQETVSCAKSFVPKKKSTKFTA